MPSNLSPASLDRGAGPLFFWKYSYCSLGAITRGQSVKTGTSVTLAYSPLFLPRGFILDNPAAKHCPFFSGQQPDSHSFLSSKPGAGLRSPTPDSSRITIMDAILNGPAMVPPPGETSDFSNLPNQNPLAIGVLVTMIVISTLCVLVRLYARVYLLRKVAAEESEYSSLLSVPILICPPHAT